MTKKRLLIVAHTPSANTRALLEAVLRGARAAEAESVEVEALSPFQAGPDEVLAAQVVVLGTPENLGYMGGALKDFFDRIYYPCLERSQGRPYALSSAPATTAPALSAVSRPLSPACGGAP